MRAKKWVGRRAWRTVLVLVATLVATAAGVAVAHADYHWEISPQDGSPATPAVVVTETSQPGGPVQRDISWE